MRRLCSIIALCSFALLSSPAHSQGWVYQQLGIGRTLSAIAFADSNIGTIVGDDGLILRTTDGGLSWFRQASPTTRTLCSVHYSDPRHGAIAGDGGTVLQTTDGGGTWFEWPYPGRDFQIFYGVSFADSTTGIAVGINYYSATSSWAYKTTDGGASWSTLGFFPWYEWQALYGASYKNPDTALAVGYTVIYQTTDGWNSWNSVLDPITYQYASWYSVGLAQNGVGIVVGDQGILRSTDNGSTWSPVVPQSPYHAVSFSDSLHVTAVGTNLLSQSSDGGRTWVTSQPHWDLLGVATPGPNRVLAVGVGSVLVRSVGSDYHLPPLSLDSPRDGATGVPIDQPIISSPTGPLAFGVSFRWRLFPYTRFAGTTYRIQVSRDSTFTTGIIPDTTGPMGVFDTSRVLYGDFGTEMTYYWRVLCTQTDSAPLAISERRSFTTRGYPRTSIREIQYRDSTSLFAAENGQYQYQNSLALNQIRFIIARCVVPSMKSTTGSYTPLVVCDTGSGPGAWHGLVLYDAARTGDKFAGIHTGDLIDAHGVVRETPGVNGATYLLTYFVGIIDSSDRSPLPPVLARLGDFYSGTLPNGHVVYSTGEQYEGSVVELHHVNVYTVNNASSGTVTLIDGDGNTLNTSDLFPWFTLAPANRDPASTYATPQLGAVIDTLRGLVTTGGGAYLIAPIFPTDLVLGRQRRGEISGTLFQDRNHDGRRNGHEPGIPNWSLDITGRAKGRILSDSYGNYLLAGLDTGTYAVALQEPPAHWALTTPGPTTYGVILGPDEKGAPGLFGFSYPWNALYGSVYHDQNGNGVRDAGEPGMSGMIVRLDGELPDSVLTDSTGLYRFDGVVPGVASIGLEPLPGWEQVVPLLQGKYEPDIETFSQEYPGGDFAVRPIPKRLKFSITVHDNTPFAHRDIWWGFRPGASYGIWGVDRQCKTLEHFEGEFELPPQTDGLFDARFEDAQGGMLRFGSGSWTDMRDFVSQRQVDSFKITFTPGYFYGGDYPITLSWSRDSIAHNFAGSVTLAPASGPPVDMKQTDSIVISDPSVSSATIVARGPILPPGFEKNWHLISLSTVQEPPTASATFVTMTGKAFGYSQNVGYCIEDSLVPGKGYCVRYSPAVDTIRTAGAARTSDTLKIAAGWNLLGSLSVPIDALSVETVPPGILNGRFVGYDRRYAFVDSLKPGFGYWVKARQPGKLILAAHISAAPKSTPDGIDRHLLERCYTLTLTDANGNAGDLFILPSGTLEDVEPFDLPPAVPETFDLRFGSNRTVEYAGDGGEVPISLRAEQFPLTLRWTEPPISPDGRTLTAVLKTASRTFLLNGTVSRIEEKPVSLLLSWGNTVPTDYVLDQNYPNPFNPSTSIRYGLPERARVTIRVFDLLGREVRELADGVEEAGYHSVEWDGTDGYCAPVASGLYFCRLSAAGSRTTLQIRKMLLLR